MEVSTTAVELIENHQGLVKSLATQIHRRFAGRFDLEDLIAYGQVGLAEAAHEYDPSHGAQFSTYAYYRIRGAVYDGISKMNWTGTATRRLIHYQRLAGQALETDAANSSNQSNASPEEGINWFADLTRRIAIVYLTSQSTAQECEEVQDDSMPSPPSIALRAELLQEIRQQVASLPEQERYLIEAVYFNGQTMSDAAQQLGISKSWASRLHSRVLQQLSLVLLDQQGSS